VCARAELNAELAAAAAAARAARHEQLLGDGSERLRGLHESMAATHRRLERLHRAAAMAHRAQTDRLTHTTLTSRLLVTVAGALRARGAALTLLGPDRYQESAIASDPTAAAAQELEFTLGEGPAHDAARQLRLVVADATTMPDRWAQYTRALTELGFRSVTAAPLCLGRTCVGVLTAFNPADDTAAVTTRVAGAVFHKVLATDATLVSADDRNVVHQATGMIAARLRCPIDDALAMLRARAFAENEAIGVLARRVVDRKVVFE